MLEKVCTWKIGSNWVPIIGIENFLKAGNIGAKFEVNSKTWIRKYPQNTTKSKHVDQWIIRFQSPSE